MPNSLWLESGAVKKDASGNLILCDSCPCGSDPCACPQCPSCIAECWELTVAGVTSGECDCTAVDGTYVLIRSASVACFAASANFTSEYFDVNFEACVSGAFSWRLFRNTVAEVWRLALGEQSGSGLIIVEYQLSFASFICDDTNVFDFVSSTSECSDWPATLTLDPIACP